MSSWLQQTQEKEKKYTNIYNQSKQHPIPAAYEVKENSHIYTIYNAVKGQHTCHNEKINK